MLFICRKYLRACRSCWSHHLPRQVKVASRTASSRKLQRTLDYRPLLQRILRKWSTSPMLVRLSSRLSMFRCTRSSLLLSLKHLGQVSPCTCIECTLRRLFRLCLGCTAGAAQPLWSSRMSLCTIEWVLMSNLQSPKHLSSFTPLSSPFS